MEIIKIKIDSEPFVCFVLSDGRKYIAASISKFFTSNSDIQPIVVEEIREFTAARVLLLETVISNLRPRFLKELASEGLSNRIDKAIKQRDNQEERTLSEFDKIMLKALKYNPNENPQTK